MKREAPSQTDNRPEFPAVTPHSMSPLFIGRPARVWLAAIAMTVLMKRS